MLRYFIVCFIVDASLTLLLLRKDLLSSYMNMIVSSLVFFIFLKNRLFQVNHFTFQSICIIRDVQAQLFFSVIC